LSEPSVRLADQGDFDAVTALLEELGRATVTDETRDACRTLFENHVADGDAQHLVACEEDGTVIGFCSLHFRERLNHPTPDAWVPDLIVTERAQGRGTGRALLAEAERRAATRGCWQLTLESAHFRTEAHRFYEAFGMEDAGKYFTKRLEPGLNS
jgi:GNAT superfamily N-acetyltransferase